VRIGDDLPTDLDDDVPGGREALDAVERLPRAADRLLALLVPPSERGPVEKGVAVEVGIVDDEGGAGEGRPAGLDVVCRAAGRVHGERLPWGEDRQRCRVGLDPPVGAIPAIGGHQPPGDVGDGHRVHRHDPARLLDQTGGGGVDGRGVAEVGPDPPNDRLHPQLGQRGTQHGAHLDGRDGAPFRVVRPM
jgi:hypothetical protein